MTKRCVQYARRPLISIHRERTHNSPLPRMHSHVHSCRLHFIASDLPTYSLTRRARSILNHGKVVTWTLCIYANELSGRDRTWIERASTARTRSSCKIDTVKSSRPSANRNYPWQIANASSAVNGSSRICRCQLARSRSASGERPSSTVFARSVELSSSFAHASTDKGDERTRLTLGRLCDILAWISTG